MGAAFWIKRYLLAAVPLFVILAGVEYVKGTPSQADILSAGVWAAVAAAIFVGTQYRRHRKNQECAPCDAVGKSTKPHKPNTRS